jgi:predicted amidohydrolase
MSESYRVGLVQMNTQSDKQTNLATAERLIDEAAARGARFVALPEYVSFLGKVDAIEEVAESIPGPTTERFAAKARQHGIYLLGGSIQERSDIPGKAYNTAVFYGPDGSILDVYRKIHLFDIDISGNVSANESQRIEPGDTIVTVEADGHVFGLSICYDLRFPELYRLLALEGADILLVPAAFTMFTGKDHWHALLRARAIENQAFVLAPAQIGPHDPNAQCYGHTVIIDPWGIVIAQAPDTEGVVVADLNFDELRRIRRQLPSLANRRPAAYRSRLTVES